MPAVRSVQVSARCLQRSKEVRTHAAVIVRVRPLRAKSAMKTQTQCAQRQNRHAQREEGNANGARAPANPIIFDVPSQRSRASRERVLGHVIVQRHIHRSGGARQLLPVHAASSTF